MNLIGHSKQEKYFKNLVKNGELGHAYLFTGQEMIGKRSFGLELFKLANTRELVGDPDFIFVAPDIEEEETKIRIEDIRKLKSFFSLKPYFGPYKFGLIDDAHTMTAEAANALLKILEEPPGASVLVLVSSMPGLLPSTVRSRCEMVRFGLADKKTTEVYLTGKKIKNEDVEFIIKLAGGKIGLINKLLEEDGIKDAKKAVDDLRKLLTSPVHERMKYAAKVHEKGDYRPRVDYWLGWVSAHVSVAPKNEKIVKNLLSLHSIISQPQYNHRLALENFLLNL